MGNRCPSCGFKTLIDNDIFYYCEECGLNIEKGGNNENE